MIPFLGPTDPFPPVNEALDEPDGLLAAGADLSPARLVEAYSHGIFPWFNEGDPILWWSPDPRIVLAPSDFHVSHSLKKRLGRDHALSVALWESGWYEARLLAAFVGDPQRVTRVVLPSEIRRTRSPGTKV